MPESRVLIYYDPDTQDVALWEVVLCAGDEWAAQVVHDALCGYIEGQALPCQMVTLDVSHTVKGIRKV